MRFAPHLPLLLMAIAAGCTGRSSPTVAEPEPTVLEAPGDAGATYAGTGNMESLKAIVFRSWLEGNGAYLKSMYLDVPPPIPGKNQTLPWLAMPSEDKVLTPLRAWVEPRQPDQYSYFHLPDEAVLEDQIVLKMPPYTIRYQTARYGGNLYLVRPLWTAKEGEGGSDAGTNPDPT